MRKLLSLALITVSLVSIFGAAVFASNPWLGKTMSKEEIKKRWGVAEFDAEKFKGGDQELRAKMTYSLITSGALKGLTAKEIREKLGDFSGHYFSEAYPTYMISEAKDESWQIVFLIDKNRKTKGVIVHKNCCD